MESLSSENKSLALDILYDIQSAIETIQKRTENIHKSDDFLETQEESILLDATCMMLIAIGESLKNLDKVTKGELLAMDTTIPWKNIKGIRDVIAHHYFDIDAGQIWWILTYEMKPLQNVINNFIEFLEQ